MRKIMVLAGVLAAALATNATSAPPKKPRPDLADAVQGVYTGDVISDSRGSGRPGVTFTVTRIGPNTVQVSSDYPRLPSFTTKLAKYMTTIQNVGPGVQVFLYETAKSPPTLGVTDDQASWTGTRSSATNPGND